jgi:hypothetical protein
MFPQSMIAGGNFTLTTALIASGVQVICQSQSPPDFVVAKNITRWGAASSATAIEWWWERSMAQQAARGILQASNASSPVSAALTSTAVTASGISVYNTASPPTFAALANTTITGTAGTFVVSMANTGSIVVGDYVRLYNQTGMQQISGFTFQVTAVTTNSSITLGYMASSGITTSANATAGFVQKIIPNRFYPKEKRIANITQAVNPTVYFMQTNDFTPGEQVSFRIPSSQWGMTQLNNVKARVLTVTNSATVSSITIELDTSGFNAFTFPTSAQAVAGISPAVCIPSASMVVPDPNNLPQALQPPGTNLLDAFDDRNVNLIFFGAGLFNVSGFTATNGDVWEYQAYKYDTYNNQ